MSEDAARLLAELHAARGLMRVPSRGAKVDPSHARLWAHATRTPDLPVDFAVERAVRSDPETARRYRTMLAGQAIAHAPLAVAASDGDLSRRRVGPFELEIVPADGDGPPLLIMRGPGARPPVAIEAVLAQRSGDGATDGSATETARLALPPAIEGATVLALDPLVPEADRLGRLLREPACAVFIL